MKVIKGDLIKLALAGKFTLIIHGCNCHNNMGKGIAKTISHYWPGARVADSKTIKGDKSKLGTYTSYTENGLTIVNGYTQYNYGRGVHADYKAIKELFDKVALDFPNEVIGIPKIGAGLAGGDWNIIKDIINNCGHNNITLVEYDS
jgi:O-acetyl-ADP-ribose deacetylase (regulator of RNase III)